ncbi:hypothetical protein FRB97_009269 [Tulasnella sp. 331]|nr:hypothetical protein FRB97_009269 [Tulasnella sp. 331]
MSALSSSTKLKHFLLTTIPALGHIRAESGIVCELIKTEPHLIFTVLVPKFLAPVFSRELTQWSVTEADLARIRATELREVYQLIIAQESITCTATDTVFDYKGITPPTAVFSDLFTPAFAPYIKEKTPDVKIVNLWIITSGSILWHHGKGEHGGLFEWEARTKAVFEKGEDCGRTFDEVAQSVWREPNSGKLLPNADGVKMYDYESYPQPSNGTPPVSMIMGAIRQATQFADASITATTSAFEPASSKLLNDWYEGELGKKVFNFGPLVPFSAAPYTTPPLPSQGPFQPIFSFLDSQPPKSVMLVSFGSIFFPSKGWQLEAVLKTLLEMRTPFILSRAPAMFQPLDPKLEETVEDSGLGLFVDYVPQRDILGHPNLGSFLTHGGNNSMWESIGAGVPNIFWPFDADQPIHAAYMTEVLDCSWELMQVRAGEGAQPPARGGKVEGTPDAVTAELKQILIDLKGEVGERKRKNLEAVRKQTLDALSEGGEVRKDVQAVLKLASGDA